MKKLPRTLYLALFLLALGVIAGSLLAGVNAITKPVIEQNAIKELEKNLADVNVKNPKDISSTVKLVSGVSSVYSGEFDGKECYVFNTANSNKYTTVKVLVVLAKEDGKILNFKVTGEPSITTHGFDASFAGELGVIGETSSDKLVSISGATFSRGSVKACLDAAINMYNAMKGAN